MDDLGREKRVIVVDDDKTILDFMGLVIKRKNCKFRLFDCPQKALEFFGKNPEADLLITDFTMPGLNGEQLAQKAKEINGGVPIVLYTGYNDTPYDESLFEEVLSKPSSLNEINNCLDRFLERKQ